MKFITWDLFLTLFFSSGGLRMSGIVLTLFVTVQQCIAGKSTHSIAGTSTQSIVETGTHSEKAETVTTFGRRQSTNTYASPTTFLRMPSTSEGSCKISLKPYIGDSRIQPTIEKKYMTLLLVLGFGGFSLLIAGCYKSLRRYVFHDEHGLDTVFDAGGRVSFSLTAVTVTSQLLWPANFLISATLTIKAGLGGVMWMAIGVIVDILMFPTLSLFLKTRAPGAKTFPQIAYARFGKPAHILFCVLAIMSSLIVCTTMLLSGKTAMEVLGKDVNSEFIFIILAVLFGSYCMVGGLGTTFYISYFNTALTFLPVSVYILYTSYFPSEEVKKYTLADSLYNAVSCLKAPDGNYNNSFLTFRSETGLLFGIVILFMATSMSFTDQANWQSRIAAKPSEGVLGFFLAAYMWPVVPLVFSYTAAMTYFTISAENGTHVLSAQEIDEGYATPFVMNHLLGETGGYLLLTMLMMTLMATGSGEVMAISSIVVYDIYKTYINPFRKGLSPTCCLLCCCEKPLDHKMENMDTFCHCPSVIGCMRCAKDIVERQNKGIEVVTYLCEVHGEYRRYEDGLMRYKSWCMVWVVILIIPYGLLISESGMNVYWASLSIPVFTSPFLWPLFLTMTWSKATSKGVISGAVVGLIVSIVAMLITASTYEGGLSNFYVNTAQTYTLLAAMVGGFGIGGLVCVVVSMCTHNIKSNGDAEHEWAKTLSIDNPINPFRLVYEEELGKIGVGSVITAKIMDKIFRKARLYATVGGISSIILFVVIIPAIALSFGELTLDQFTAWLNTFQIYCFVCTFLVVVFPPLEEGYLIWKRYQHNKKANSPNIGVQDNSVRM